MKQNLVSLFAGFIFGIGLALSQMINPDKVLNFLDVFGNWDPSLAFVMIGALAISFIAFHFIPQRTAPLFEEKFSLPTRKDLDKPLIIGAILFGIGWGIAGYCPGPAIANLALASQDTLIFVISMIAGFYLQRFFSVEKS